MSAQEPTEDQLRAAYEEELKRLRVEDVLVQTIVSLINLGGRKAGLTPGTEAEQDLEQVRQAVEGARALMPLVEGALGPELGPLRDALAQLQLAYARQSGVQPVSAAPGPAAPGAGRATRPPPPPPAAPAEPGSEDAGPAQRSGRLWVPGQ